MEKKLQVFVSSTYLDLKKERQGAVQAILKSGHIPAGMELFTAGSESQLETIKRWIDEADIYMLILGGRYGSLEPVTSLSYTEIEYDYAVTTGTPFFSVVIDEKELQKRGDASTEQNSTSAEKLAIFREKVLRRTSSFFTDEKDVKPAVMETVADFESRYDLEGWVKGNHHDNTKLLIELNDLRKKVDDYRGRLDVLSAASHPELASGTDQFELKGTYKISTFTTKWSATLTWDEIFSFIGPELFQHVNQAAVNTSLARSVLTHTQPKVTDKYPSVDKETFETVGIHLHGLGLIEINDLTTTIKTVALFWRLTDKGRKYLTEIRAVKRISNRPKS